MCMCNVIIVIWNNINENNNNNMNNDMCINM